MKTKRNKKAAAIKPLPLRKGFVGTREHLTPLQPNEIAFAVEVFRAGPKSRFSVVGGALYDQMTDEALVVTTPKLALYLQQLHNAVPRLVYNVIELQKENAAMKAALVKAGK